MSNTFQIEGHLFTGANDVIAVVDDAGDILATPFHVQFGKKDMWLPRAGHLVSLEVNNHCVPLEMLLDSDGQGYFTSSEGVKDPTSEDRTYYATCLQLAQLGLVHGPNSLKYLVTTSAGFVVTTSAVVYLVDKEAKLVVSDIDGTVTKSDMRGLVLPALGLSNWIHHGVVELYRRIADQGYLIVYLTNRAIGQSHSTRNYVHSLTQSTYSMPRGPILLQVESVFDAVKTEVTKDHPGANKVVALNRVKKLFTTNPLFSAFGNAAWDTLAFKTVDISPERIFNVDEASRLTCIGTGEITTYRDIIENVIALYPQTGKVKDALEYRGVIIEEGDVLTKENVLTERAQETMRGELYHEKRRQ